jgi:hypothetical protein
MKTKCAPKEISARTRKFLEKAQEIWDNPNTPETDKAFMARQLVQITLPHSNPGSVPIWQRRNGHLTLSIRPGWNYEKNELLGLPYGSIPRLLLFWLTTEALRTKSRRIELGKSLADFMRELGMNPETGGGKRGDGVRLREQMERLFRSTISFDVDSDSLGIKNKKWVDMQIASEGELWWDLKNPEQPTLLGSWIELGEKFYQAITASPVPLDKRALNALKQSPLALDLYAWTTYKSFVLYHHPYKKEQFIPWETFKDQLGTEYADAKNFKRKTKEAIQKVNSVYPHLRFEIAKGGFVIKAAEPSVKMTLKNRG